MNWSHDFSLFLMLAFLLAVFAIFVWFTSRLLRSSRRERGATVEALETVRGLLEAGKITTRKFETIKRGLGNP